jgi:hypothetical protein
MCRFRYKFLESKSKNKRIIRFRKDIFQNIENLIQKGSSLQSDFHINKGFTLCVNRDIRYIR